MDGRELKGRLQDLRDRLDVVQGKVNKLYGDKGHTMILILLWIIFLRGCGPTP